MKTIRVNERKDGKWSVVGPTFPTAAFDDGEKALIFAGEQVAKMMGEVRIIVRNQTGGLASRRIGGAL